ncbi:MAG: hypothetical protein HRT66_11840 [Flavobacteriaceae bacterium]|nr:hypothetical protein [Flavobacteriaceae bacterium]
MRRKIEEELLVLAHKVLKINNKTDLNSLKNDAKNLYEGLTALVFLENTLDKEKADILLGNQWIKELFTHKLSEFVDKPANDNLDKIEVKPIVKPQITETKPVEKEIEKNQTSELDLEEVHYFENLNSEFSKQFKNNTPEDIFKDKTQEKKTKTSLNDRLSKNKINIDLNDRIAFVKHLFQGDNTLFKESIGVLNSYKEVKQALYYVENNLKTKLNWDDKKDYEKRFMTLIKRKFVN